MKIHFLGGSDEVGASCLLIEMAGQRLLVDAGIRVSPKARDGLSGELLPDLSPLSAGRLDAVLITHAHADHIGAVPLVLGAMPDVPAYATPATIGLMRVMLQDALRIMDTRSEQEGELPHYDEIQVAHLENSLRPVELHQPFFINGAVKVQYFRAGHIPGAASIYLESAEGSLLVSGDLSFSPMRATPIAEVPRLSPDVLILETTYGGRLHANRKAEELRLIDSITKIAEQGGRVLIPAFALGRAQEVALILDSAIANTQMPKIPVYLDGMARSITQVFAQHPTSLSDAQQQWLQKGEGMWRSSAIKAVKSTVERDQLVRTMQPAVIIASSGMLTGGASPVYAAQIVKEPASAIFITGYQDEESPGKALQKLAAAGGGTLQLDGKKHQVMCQVGTYSLSAHADENELTQYAVQLEPQRVYLVHGDENARERMQSLLRERQLNASLVRLGQVVEPLLESRQALGVLRAQGVGAGEPLTGEGLWQKLIEHDLAKATLSLAQVAQFWYGEADLGLVEIENCLRKSPLYFAPDWRDATAFKVRSPQQVEQHRERYGWIEQLGDLEGKLLVMQSGEQVPFLAVGKKVEGIQITAVSAQSPEFTTVVERVLGVLDNYPIPTSEDEYMILQRKLSQQEALVTAQSQEILSIVQIASLMDSVPRSLEVIAADFALDLSDPVAKSALIWRLLEFKANADFGKYSLSPRTTSGSSENPASDDLDFTSATTLIQQMIPSEARLRKVSGDQANRVISLRFDFPDVAVAHYQDLIRQCAVITGWQVLVHESVNNLALEAVARHLLPDLVATPSIYMDQRVVEVKLDPLPADWEGLRAMYRVETGFDLVSKSQAATNAVPSKLPVSIPHPRRQAMEINAAFERLRQQLTPLGLYKASLKEGTIVLSFITPELGQRHQALINDLADQVGYPLTIHPHPNQNDLIALVNQLCTQRGIKLKKNPSIQIAQRSLVISPVTTLDATTVEELQAVFEQQTAYQVVVKVS